MNEKRHYEAPSTTLVRVELESDICAGSQNGRPVNGDNAHRHVNINKQDDGGSIDFTSSPDTDNWD